MESIKTFFDAYLPWLSIPHMNILWTDVLEIIILSFVVYHVLKWIRETRAWTLLKGILLLVFCITLAYVFQMSTMMFLVDKGLGVALTAAAVIFQPELRMALEHLGEKRFFESILPLDAVKDTSERFSDKTINEMVKGTMEMGRDKTGALIVIEQNETLVDYIKTGIPIDSLITSQLLLNIFEHNTPLHDGAIIVRGDRIIAATCYLPLSDNMSLSKDLGTRHRAGVGISEVTDSLTIIVSEETGKVSVAYKGLLTRNITAEQLREKLVILQNKTVDSKKFRIFKRKEKS